MSSVDIQVTKQKSVPPLQSMAYRLQDVMERLDSLATFSGKLINILDDKPNQLSFVNCNDTATLINTLWQDVQKIHGSLQELHDERLLVPLKKIGDLFPNVNSLVEEKEELRREVDKNNKKRQKYESMERFGENLAKLGKSTKAVDAANARIEVIDELLQKGLYELTLRVEEYIFVVLKAHLNWGFRYQTALSVASGELAESLRGHVSTAAGNLGHSPLPASLAQLDASMTNDLNDIRQLSLTRPA